MQQTLSVNLTLVISSLLSLTTPTLPSGTVNQPYSFQLGASGGTAPYTWSATGLPTGLTCSSSGLISGTPTTAGSYTATITVKDSGT